MQLLWHLVSTLATFFLHYNPPFDTYTLAGCWESSEHAACPLPLSWAARTAIVAFKMFLESRTQDINSGHRVTWHYPIVTPSTRRLRCLCRTVTKVNRWPYCVKVNLDNLWVTHESLVRRIMPRSPQPILFMPRRNKLFSIRLSIRMVIWKLKAQFLTSYGKMLGS